MEDDKKEKAIRQALASIRMEGLDLDDDYLEEYYKKNNLETSRNKRLVKRKEKNNEQSRR